MQSCDQLIEKIKQYNDNFDQDLLRHAYDYSKKAHEKQKRLSGELYFTHPLAVADILIDIKLDLPSIITGLLHDVIEDTLVTVDDIKKEFGEEIAILVNGVTKLSKIENQSPSEQSAENFRKLLVAMSSDIRVLLVKLSDRLHNMRTISYIKSEEKRIRIAKESILIYAPLAERIGMNQFRDEIYDLSFAQVYPEMRNYIIEKLEELKVQREDLISKVTQDLSKTLSQYDINFEISGRQKKPYSIWQKMKRKNVDFNQLFDITAFRIIVDDVELCYKVLGIINSAYHMIPDTFKDYISTPKENGYKSLHSVVLGPQNKKIEVQIRTHQMHEYAELGLAAHWCYKQGAYNKDDEQYNWIRELIHLFEVSPSISEALKDNKLEIHKDQVFCFTPAGDVFNLPIDSTPVDFAYSIHSQIGDTCVGAKVNGVIAPLRSVLKNGDQVEIITSKTAKPSPSWQQFVTTTKAKSAIKHFIRSQKREEYKNLGQAILNKYFVAQNCKFREKDLTKVLDKFSRKNIEELYAFVGEGLINRSEVLKAIYPKHNLITPDNKPASKKTESKQAKDKAKIPIDGLVPGMAIRFAGCCHPIPGDKIIGVIHTGTGVAIHHNSCPNLVNFSKNPEKLIDVCWKIDKNDSCNYSSRIKITMANKAGALAHIANIVASENTNISNITTLNRSADYFEIAVDVEVKDTEHLSSLMAAIRIPKVVYEVRRD